ncbi:crotonase/enoyl-CoA hydratase family protein [Actinocorallia sp. A-T 12471]|uniref:crotonase/enoyl-CoA hydratase family protein n=1 Tax=Actinocorallia sp. A-T 12471 TaxID=3089813 RepID=UPI0029D3433C|nr:crotonase/enoyl-CoA hydratase family protein [Actinocorallia sp. A-T 12471]MDX6738678.1 crotonase/enoyl-CoA hydratase family protein [Actinocorallia sp. A-T 12471]
MTYQEIGYEVADGVAVLTLNRPERMNAYTNTMRLETLDAFDRIDADDAVRAVVVTGAGRAFCAGADLEGGGDTFNYEQAKDMFAEDDTLSDGKTPRDGGGTVVLRIARCLKPVIAAVNGAAVGVGATMTLPMDVRIASENAKFGFVFARRGIVTEAASSWYLPRVVGISQAMEWAMTGRVFPASEALAGRLVSRVVPPEELLPAAIALGREVADNTSAVAVAAIRRLMYAGLSAETPWQAHANDSRLMTELGSAPDAAEGITSFLEKRAAVFPMKVSGDLPEALPEFPKRRED